MGSVGPFVSVYVDNLPFEMDIVWLSQLFRGFGEVVDVYIPKKRSSRFNTKFGFVRFNSKEEALRAVQALHGIRIRDFNIQVNLARYSQARGSRNLLQSSNVFITSGRNSKASVYQVKRSGNTNLVDDSCPSYADIVAGKNASSIRPSIKVHIDDNQWLLRSAVAKLPSQRSVESLREAFISDGVWNIQIRPMGGIYVLLTFDSVEDMNSMLEGSGLCWLMNWFVEVKQWALEPTLEYSRVVWLNCYGIPLNVWNAETFYNIGRLWGEVITLDEETSNKSSFAVGKVKISTNAFEIINHIVNLELNGIVYPIRVVEHQVGVTSFVKAVCECNGVGNTKQVYSSDSEGKSEGEKEVNVEVEDVLVETNDLSDMGENFQVLPPIAEVAFDDGVVEVNGENDKVSTCSDKTKVEADDLVIAKESVGKNCEDPLMKDFVLDPDKVDMGSINEPHEGSNNDEVNKEDLVSDPLLDHFEANQIAIQAAIKGSKGKRNRKSINEILGYTNLKTGKSKGKRSNKCVVVRSAIASAALSASISSEAINNRNKILLDEAQAIWAVDKLFGISYDGDENEVISKIAEMEALNKERIVDHH